MREQKPANDATDNVASGKRDVDIECLELGKACCFKKDNRIAENSISAKDLGSPDHAVL